MAEELHYAAIIVTPQLDDYRRRPSGGKEPRSFDNIEVTQERLLRSCSIIKDGLNKGDKSDRQPIGIARLKLRDEALAKSHRPIEAFTDETCPVIGDLDGMGELLVLVSPERLDRLSKRIGSLGKAGSAHLTSIESFELVEKERRFPRLVQSAVFERLQQHGQARLKIRLPNFHIFAPLFRDELEEQKLTLIKMGVVEEPYLHQGDFEVYAVQIHNMEEAILLASLSFVDRLDLMPIYIPAGSAIINVASLRLRINSSLNNLPVVAIVDSGIDPNSPLEPLVYAREVCVTQNAYNPSHGTSVAALAAASDGLVGSTLVPRCRLLDVTVIGDAELLYEDLLIRRLEIAVEKYCSDVKYWNMSLATTPGPRSTTFSDLAMALDDLQKRYDVTFVCAAGNNPQNRRQWPPDPNNAIDWWVPPPGDTVCGITVGSYTGDNVPDNALAPKGAPSPFSPRGPVAYNIIKPDLLEFGGNIAADGTDIGVSTIQRNGDPCLNTGTSFASPRVCGASAEINTCVLQSNASGNVNSQLLTKALMLHHAKVPDDFALVGNFQPSDYYGYGVPSSLENTIGDPFWRSTTLICGQLYPDGEDIVMNDFPYPEGLRSDKRSWGQIWITMVSNPILDPSFKAEYIRSNLDVHFGTVRQGKFAGQVKSIHTGSGSEMSLIREQHKWSQIKQYRSPSRMDCLGNQWRLRISLTLREKESNQIREGTTTVRDYPVDFVIAVTIADPLGLVPVNSQIFQQWRMRGYVPVQIGIAPRLRTRFATNSGN